MTSHTPRPTQAVQWFTSIALMLIGVGVMMVLSSSITSRPTEFEQVYLSRHVTFLSLAVTAGIVAGCVPPRMWPRLAPVLFGITLLLLVAVLIPGVGHSVKGAQRWLRLGSVSMQPSELAKVTLPLMVCTLLVRRTDRLRRPIAGTLPILLPAVLLIGLVIVEPDLGTALLLLMTTALALWLGGWPLRNFVAFGTLAGAAGFLLVGLRPYQVRRITGFVATWSNVDAAPYQLRQSLTTLGVGGITGTGLGAGGQKLSFLPEANTDFVFAVIGEELGLVGTLGVVSLWLALFVTGARMLQPLPRKSFAFLAGMTLLCQLILQAAINVAVVTAMVPPKGIAHPLISAGGSNLVMSVVTLGIIVSLSRGSGECIGDAVPR